MLIHCSRARISRRCLNSTDGATTVGVAGELAMAETLKKSWSRRKSKFCCRGSKFYVSPVIPQGGAARPSQIDGRSGSNASQGWKTGARRGVCAIGPRETV